MLLRIVRLAVASAILLFLNIPSAKAFHLFSFSLTKQAASTYYPTIDAITRKTMGLDPNVLELALNAYNKLHQQGYDAQQMLTIIDFSKPSTEPRLWVIDLKHLDVLFHELVAHGKNSGANIPTTFSNLPSSLQSSIGVFLTGNTYLGKHGYSLRLNGLEPGFNEKAAAREIVIHAADYVNVQFARIHGRLGRSWGCPAISPDVAPTIINQIKNGTVVFAYYPDKTWLSHSAYLQT